jgi:hypothetical protein
VNAHVRPFNWTKPDYAAEFAARMRRLAWIREDKTGTRLAQLKAWYREHPADFIDDWGITFDPRNPEIGLPAEIPFRLFPKQREWIDAVLEQWRKRKGMLTEKSRDCGISWVAVALACTLCLFNRGLAIGFGSNLERNVDKIGEPKSLFFKARMFLRNLPPEFLDGWDEKRDAPAMLIKFPGTGAVITGEGGDQVGRGGRNSIYFVDEAAHLDHPQLIDASLSATTNCRIDISSVNGMNNPFALKRWGGKLRVFIFDWRDDPRKDQAWYDAFCEEHDPVTVAQEVDRNYNASALGVLIPSEWVEAAIDSLAKLGVAPTGVRAGGLDVADEGKDLNAFCARYGPLLEHLEEWSGKGSDTFATTVKAFDICDTLQLDGFKYDADGLGAGCRGDARVINEGRAAAGRRQLTASPFRGSGEVFDPEGEDVKGRKNKDYFARLKPQAWWSLRLRFQNTYRAVTKSGPFDINHIICIPSSLPILAKLKGELSQPTYKLTTDGKIEVNKQPDGTKSPNLADAVMIAYSSTSRQPMRISDDALRGLL